ncbi:MAG: hypothetical protein GEU68_07965 [Actinobacteria bacterium]|nr:hypothetical protein [Actinomycetota bacterium]
MFQTDEVNERVVTGEPVSETSRDEQSEQVPDEEGERPPRNVELARGLFVGLAHPGSGVAAVVALAEGGRKLTLTKFATDNGPDLRVYLSTKNPAQSRELGEFKDVGALKGNAGDQQYDIPNNLDLDPFSNVVIWCRHSAWDSPRHPSKPLELRATGSTLGQQPEAGAGRLMPTPSPRGRERVRAERRPGGRPD